MVLLGTSFIMARATPQEAPSIDLQTKTNRIADVTSASGMKSFYTNGYVTAIFSNDVVVTVLEADKTTNAILTADRVSINDKTGDLVADGSVHLFRQDIVWAGPHLHYNYISQQTDAAEFRTGKVPFFAAGSELHGIGEGTNGVYVATNGLITTDDYYEPLQKIRAKEITIVPGQYYKARNATLYMGDVPVFFLPYYHHTVTEDQNNFTLLPGYRSAFGPYLLTKYNWFLNEELAGTLHADWREKRGFAGGPDFDYHLGDWGSGTLKYYYTHDEDPGLNPFDGTPIPGQRERLYFSYDANPRPGLTIKSQVAYWSDPFVVRDFFESEYVKDVQPNTFVEVNQFWRNWSLDALTQPRVNPFFESVDRLPDVRLTGFQQQIFDTPLYYESESSAGYYERLFADTNVTMASFAAARADTFHQITLPETLFGWLNVTPRAGGRFTYYEAASGPGAMTTEEDRGVFNTGAEVSFKASRLWSGAKSSFWDVDGLRHIIEPSLNYVYVPRPNVLPSQLPQFDYEPTNFLEMLPIEFPAYNSIDSIDSQNTMRFGLNNRLQTKRDAELDDLLNWGVYTDWRLRTRTNQTTFSDIFSDLEIKPRSWLTFDSKTRYDIETGRFNLALHRITFQPNNTWSWTVGHYYLRDGLFGTGDNLLSSILFYRFNENWGTRIAHYFDARTGNLQEQDYTIYRDLRSWTAALTFRALNSESNGHDYTVAFTFSFKSFPRFPVGRDTVNATSLIGN